MQKQSLLGGIAGIALLLFALAYRFWPGQPAAEAAREEPSLPAWPVHAPPMSMQAAAPAVPAAVPESAVAQALAMGPPASLAIPPPTSKAVTALLRKADEAFDAGRLLDARNGALALYRQALDADARNPAAKAGIERVGEALVQQAQAALERGDEDESARIIAALRAQSLGAASVPSLDARLGKLRQTKPLLTQAAQLLHAPADGSEAAANQEQAQAIYRQVLRIDADNRLADQGLAQIERGYLDRALAAAARDDYAGAETILGAASDLRPGSRELLDARTQIESIRRQRASAVLAQANSALDAGDADLAQSLAQQALKLSPDLAGMDAFAERLINARLYASHRPGQIVEDAFVDRNGAAPALAVIPAGSFLMGSAAQEMGHRDDEEPQHEVKIARGFALGRDAVSVAQFRAFVDDTHYLSDAEKAGASVVYDEDSGRTLERKGVNWRNDYRGAGAAGDLPVVHVSWNDANAYAQWLVARTGKRYRLPSEAEYEYALRAGTTSSYPWGEGNPPPRWANLTGDGDLSPSRRRWANAFAHYADGFWGPAPLGSFAANAFGVRDIDGNLANWVEDCWHDSYLRAPADGRAWVNPGCERHLVRGASWGSAPEQARAAFRASLPTQANNVQVGFRVARDL